MGCEAVAERVGGDPVRDACQESGFPDHFPDVLAGEGQAAAAHEEAVRFRGEAGTRFGEIGDELLAHGRVHGHVALLAAFAHDPDNAPRLVEVIRLHAAEL